MYAVVYRILSSSTARSFINFSLLAREQKPYRRKVRAFDALQRQTLSESAHRNMERNLNSPVAGNKEQRLFSGCQDRYNGLLVDSSQEPCENLHFAQRLEGM